jgi:hypothetical protein
VFTSCSAKYGPLQFQPRVVAGLFMVGLITQWWALFLVLSAALWVSALRPEKNPFEFVYNRTLGNKPGAEKLGIAPAPRRFAQGMAATFTLLISICLFFNRPVWAWLLEGLMGLALGALLLIGFCLGSTIYYALHGQWDFAKRTLPWA